MYTDNSIRKWDFEQQDLLDIREVLYQEALVKISNLEYELKMKKWELESADQARSFWERSYERLMEKYIKL